MKSNKNNLIMILIGFLMAVALFVAFTLGKESKVSPQGLSKSSPTPFCKNISIEDAVDVVFNQKEVKEYFELIKSLDGKPNIMPIEPVNDNQKVITIKLANDNGITNSASNWYMVDRCSGQIRCSMYSDNKLNNNYPCDE